MYGGTEGIFIESCPYAQYTGPGARATNAIERYYYVREVKLVEAQTGQTIRSESFTGTSPPYCHEKERFGEKETVIRLRGSDISSDEVQRWAKTHLVIR